MTRMRKTSLLAAAAVLGLTLLAGVEAKAQTFAGSASTGWGHMTAWTSPTTTSSPTTGYGMMAWTSPTTTSSSTTGSGSTYGLETMHNSMWDYMEEFWR